jgi:ABC-type uncharacterized transport system permease subunit
MDTSKSRALGGVLTWVFACYLLKSEWNAPLDLADWLTLVGVSALVGVTSPLLGDFFRRRFNASRVITFVLLWWVAVLLLSVVIRGGALLYAQLARDAPYPYVPLKNPASFSFWGNMLGDAVRGAGIGAALWVSMYWKPNLTATKHIAGKVIAATFLFLVFIQVSFWAYRAAAYSMQSPSVPEEIEPN